MPNNQQLVFLLTFFGGLTVLFTVSHLVQAKLTSAGFRIGDLILLGLPRNESRNASEPHFSLTDPVPYLLKMASEATSGFDINAFIAQNQTALASALGVVVLATLFVMYGRKPTPPTPVLDPKMWKEFALVEKVPISHNTAVYRFGLPKPDDVLGLPIGQHIQISAEIDGKDVMRSYTPTTLDDARGHFDLVIKSYPQGNISKHVSLLKIGNKVRVKGPKGQFNYTPGLSRALGMIAGGTGIAPMLQICKAIAQNPADKTQVSLIFANISEDDILLRDEINAMVASRPDQIHVYYVLNNPPAGWTGGVGFVTKEHIAEHLPPPSSDIKILMCGPPPMISAMKKHLADLKYDEPRTISKLADQVFMF